MHPRPAARILPLAFVSLIGCVQTVPRGPDLGSCAEPPDGVYSFGEVGIGTCLAGPVDLQFIERDGERWLAVSNADPFLSFTGGSLLFLDWDAILAATDAGETRITVDEVAAAVVPTEHFIGAIGWLPDRDLALLTRRLTPGARTRSGEDSAYVIDLTGPALLEGAEVPLKDDPGDVVVDPARDRAYVLNFTDHSISVLDTSTGPVRPIDLAPEASLTALPFDDADGSGSVATVDRLTLQSPADVPTDRYTLRWNGGSVWVWVPDGDGLLRASAHIGDPYRFDPFGPVVDLLPAVHDPIVSLTRVDAAYGSSAGPLEILFASEGLILGTQGLGGIDAWSPAYVLLEGLEDSWQEVLTAPSRVLYDGSPALFYAGSRADEPERASIGLALPDASGAFVLGPAPFLEAPAGESYEQPFAQLDPNTVSGRLWWSHHDGDRYRILTTRFDDLAKDPAAPHPIRVALELDRSIAAPVVRYVAGAYHLWAARDDGGVWTHVYARSSDGIHWSEPTALFASPAPYDPRRPPRLAVLHTEGGSWQVEGRDAGRLDLFVSPGVRVVDSQRGFGFTVAQGQELVAETLFPLGRASGGLRPGSYVDVDGIGHLFVTTRGDDGRERIAVLDDATGPWDVLRQDLIPASQGGNEAGASDPVVFRPTPDGPWVMFYSGIEASGLRRIHAATSDDGVRFTPRGDALFPDLADWASAEQRPHSVEIVDGAVLLWFSGHDGSRWRIGAVRITDLTDDPATATYTLETLPFTDFQLAAGPPGSADDSGVKDPVVIADPEDGRTLWYAGFDGSRWSLCRAVFDGEAWIRRTDRVTDTTLPSMTGAPGTFAVAGVSDPVLAPLPDGALGLYFAGYDFPDGADSIPRLGRARIEGAFAFPLYRQPTAGDTLGFESQRGDERTSVIELEQRVSDFYTSGIGTTSLIHDPDAGFLYVPSKLSNLLYVVDIREDVRQGRPDANAMDMETVVRFETVQNAAGFRGGVLDRARDRLYLTTRNPDGIAVLDTQMVVDDDDKEITSGAFLTTWALQDDRQDRGASSVASIGGAQPALHGDLLIVPNFNDNSVSVFDLGLGTYGEVVSWVPAIGENPHTVAISPDGRFAVIANYLGDVEDGVAHSTLALLDIDPNSPTYLTVPHWIVNR